MPLDPDLPLPSPPRDIPALEAPSDLLVHAGPAVRRPFVLTAPRARVMGDEIRGIGSVELDGIPLLADVRGLTAPASNVLIGPREIRREMLGPAGTVLQSAVLAEGLPAVAIQWARGSGKNGARHPAARPTFRLPAPVGRYRAEGALLRVDTPDGAATTLVLLDPPPSEWSITEGPGREGSGPARGAGVRVEAVPPPHTPRVTLVVLRADARAELDALLAAAGRIRVHQARAEAALRAQREHGLALATGVAELDEGLAWAIARLEQSAPRPADRSLLLPGELQGALSTLALTISGSTDAGRAVAERLDPADPGAFLARAWLASWTGTPGEGWDDSTSLRDRIAALETVEPPRPALVGAAFSAAATLLEIAGDRSGAAELRRKHRVRHARSTPRAASGGLQLPVLDTPDDSATTAADGRRLILQAFLATAAPHPGAPPPEGGVDTRRHVDASLPPTSLLGSADPDSDLERGLLAWALLASGADPDRGYLLLRELLARGFRDMAGAWRAAEGSGPPDGSGTPQTPRPPDDPIIPTLIPPALLCGLLGTRPDAPVHRLRLAPVLPGSWTSFRITGIPLGDARLELAYSVEGRHRTFVLRPTAGRMPVTVVFEPAVPGIVDRVLVDGRPSDAEVVGRGGRTGTRLQIPVDRERSVTLVETDD